MAGAELEAWLVDETCRPVAKNIEFLERFNDPLAVPELSLFNVEFNCLPAELQGNVLSTLENNLQDTWTRAGDAAADLGLELAMIGILPTVRHEQMCTTNMSHSPRYEALSEQLFRLRKNKPIQLAIEGRDRLETTQTDLMLEAATTSFQIHLQVSNKEGARYYNASKIASAALVAVAANSPYLFGKNLWAETRIPLFEQAISAGQWDYSERVTFGIRYLEETLLGAFMANRQRYPVILPDVKDDMPPARLHHLRMHNGTVWRWNRPLVGFDSDGTPHLRIEQRVVPAGPTIVDSIANTAFYYGLVHYWANLPEPPENIILFHVARDNFYAAAHYGLDATVEWSDRMTIDMAQTDLRTLILDKFLGFAAEGLAIAGVDPSEAEHYLSIIEARVTSKQNGAHWQRAHVARHGATMRELCRAYLDRQKTGEPVHTWSL